MKQQFPNRLISNAVIFTFLAFCLLPLPALAHHPLGGRVPANFFEGIMSGFGHPIIGLDHFAFIVASGLMAVGVARGFIIPVVFVFATAIGAGMHLLSLDLPIPELVIASSVILFGVLLASRKQKSQFSPTYTAILAVLAAIAGIFHGHAYGEGIFGAEPTPLAAYLVGFTVIQLAIATGAYLIAKRISVSYLMRLAGLAIAGIGFAFFSSAILGG